MSVFRCFNGELHRRGHDIWWHHLILDWRISQYCILWVKQ